MNCTAVLLAISASSVLALASKRIQLQWLGLDIDAKRQAEVSALWCDLVRLGTRCRSCDRLLRRLKTSRPQVLEASSVPLACFPHGLRK